MINTPLRKPPTGWNTWNTRSMLSHVLMPEQFAIHLGIKSYHSGECLREVVVTTKKEAARVKPGPHAYDGSFTSLEVEWDGVQIRVETAIKDNHWFAVVTPLNTQLKTACLTIEAGVLWGAEGSARRTGDTLMVENTKSSVTVVTSATLREEPVTEILGPYLMVPLDGSICITTNKAQLAKTIAIVADAKTAFLESRKHRDAKMQELYDAIQICLAWDTVYDPFMQRVISPVSRAWSCDNGGWVLFDWDTYFAAWMAGMENKDLAYANAIAITELVTDRGFIPCMTRANGLKTEDRSQPPVGAITVKALCDMFHETILAETLFDILLGWNRWWSKHRDWNGYLCWGSNPYEPNIGHILETVVCNTRFASMLESGLDNSPMYKEVAYDKERNLMALADVGLMSFYIADCKALIELAREIGRHDVIEELQQRATKYAANLQNLWCEETGLFLNKRMDNGAFEHRLSPTLFYPLLAGVPTPEQAERMINEHFFNPDEFWGDWILPSIARNDPMYPEQNYWRGRIWAPQNFLVYLGLRNYELPEARKALVEKSEALLMKEWRAHGHVHENYNGDTGDGCGSEKDNSDPFYHWGGLLALISIMENEHKV